MSRRNLILRAGVIFSVVLMVFFWGINKSQPYADDIQSGLALAHAVAGCEEEFEGLHVRWPMPAEESKCRAGWDLRDQNKGQRLSELADWFAYQRFFDLLKITAIVVGVMLLAEWLLGLLIRRLVIVSSRIFRGSKNR